MSDRLLAEVQRQARIKASKDADEAADFAYRLASQLRYYVKLDDDLLREFYEWWEERC